MSDERLSRCRTASTRPSRLSSYSTRYFNFLDPSHSVFSRATYYSDMRKIHPWLRYSYSRNSGIPLATLTPGPCPPRIEELARPRIKRDTSIRQEFFDNFTNYAYSGVQSSALTAECSDRVNELARPKTISALYREPFPLPRDVPASALKARLTPRVDRLSKPKNDSNSYRKALWNDERKF